MNEDTLELRVSDILHTLLKHRLLIAVMTAAGLAVGIVLSIISYMRGEMSREYAITSSIAVTSQTANGTYANNNNGSNPNSADIYLAENMVDAVMYVLRSDRTINSAINRMNLVGVSARDIYNNLSLSQYKETQIVEIVLYWRSAEEGVQILSAINSVAPNILISTLKVGGVAIVNDPSSRYRVGGSVNASLWVYMAALGAVAGVGFSVLSLLLEPTLINTKDVETLFGLEVLGEIPESKFYFDQKHNLLIDDGDKKSEAVKEHFASAAHILSHRMGADEHQCIYITSAAPHEGKTNVAANLAVQLSDLEKKVLLIDFDVRNPALGSLFLEKVDYLQSINALYRGETSKDEAITNLTGYLDLLPAMLEHHELPLDEAMLALVRELSVEYDYVLMDTAPVGRVADTMNLNRIAKSAIFVVRYDTTSINEIREALERLDKTGVRTIGCIINGIRKMGGAFDAGKGKEVLRNVARGRKLPKLGPAFEQNENIAEDEDRPLSGAELFAAPEYAEEPAVPPMHTVQGETKQAEPAAEAAPSAPKEEKTAGTDQQETGEKKSVLKTLFGRKESKKEKAKAEPEAPAKTDAPAENKAEEAPAPVPAPAPAPVKVAEVSRPAQTEPVSEPEHYASREEVERYFAGLYDEKTEGDSFAREEWNMPAETIRPAAADPAAEDEKPEPLMNDFIAEKDEEALPVQNTQPAEEPKSVQRKEEPAPQTDSADTMTPSQKLEVLMGQRPVRNKNRTAAARPARPAPAAPKKSADTESIRSTTDDLFKMLEKY